MDRFFSAQSVAVIGVSNSPGNLGRAMMYNLMEFRYEGIVYPVGPKGGSFLGHKIYPSVLEIPDPVDLATVLVPAMAVPDVLAQCGRKGIRRVVVQSAGFGELGEDRRLLEMQIREIIEEHGLRIIGPNCIGIINRRNGLAVPFMPFKDDGPLGRVAVVSQSGGVGGNMLNLLSTENLGFSKFVSVGNKLNVNENDLGAYFCSDPESDVLFFYLESLADGRRFIEIASRSSKPLVVHKSNVGGAGAVIARSHTASLASDDRVVDAAFRQAGIVRARDQGEAVAMVKAFSLPPMKGNRLGVISRSGGHAVMAADAADEFGFELPPHSADVLELVRAESRAKVIEPHNPLDLGDLFKLPLYLTLASKTLERDDIDGLLFIHNYQGVFDAEDSRQLVKSLGDLLPTFGKPIAVCVFTRQTELELNRRAVHFPIFTDPRDAVRALAWNRGFHAHKPIALSTQRPQGVDLAKARAQVEMCGEGSVPPAQLATILEAFGVPTVLWSHAMDEQAAVDEAQRVGYPLVMKTAQPDVVHKSDVGGVVLGVSEESTVRDAYRKLGQLGPEVLLQKMAEPGLEWFVGGRQDPNFGPVVVTGAGGIYVELLGETALRVGPVCQEEVETMFHQLRGASLLSGIRGQLALDRAGLTDLIIRISWLLAEFPEILELDLNPVRVYSDRCLALDWRATIARSPVQ